MRHTRHSFVGLLVLGLLFVTAVGDARARTRPGASHRTRSGHEASSQAGPQVANLRAFAKLFGYVRYFHPSDEAAALDWERFAVYGSGRVKSATTSEELRSILEELFLPVAPTLRLYADGEPVPADPPELSLPPGSEPETVAWQHLGVGFGSAISAYKSARLNRETVLAGGAANAVLTQCLDAADLAGKEVRLRGFGIALQPGARVQFWLRVDLEGQGMGFLDNMMDRPIMSNDWVEAEIRGPVVENARQVCLGAIVLGGNGGVDDFRLEALGEDGEWESAGLENGDFEEAEDGSISGWATPSPGWSYAPATVEVPSGSQYLRVAQGRTVLSRPLFPQAPAVGEVADKPLDRGLRARVPLALYSVDGMTLGTPEPFRATALRTSLSEVSLPAMTAEDEALRLADVIMAWNVFQHFYPYFDVVDVDWDDVLTRSLERALEDRTPAQFLATLRWMVSRLQDGHGSVAGPAEPTMALPIRVDWIEEKVVVVATDDPGTFRPGDVIETIDGRPADEVLAELTETFSGSERWRRWRALGQFDLGPEGSVAELELRRDGETVEVSRLRDAARLPSEPRPANIEELEPGIFYVNLDQVEMAEFEARVEELAVARGVVFDMRGYPKGNHMVLTYLTDQHLNSAFWRVPQIIYPDHAGEAHYQESRWDLPPSEPRFQGKIAFLTDGRAISYAESVMGIVEHYRLGEIIGEATAGANGNVNPFTLPGGYGFTWTGMQVLKHDRSQHHLVGIQPTVPMSRTIQGVREGRDELLERAVEVVKGG